MSRLFVAVDLPSTSIAELARIQPPPAPGIRPTSQSQMHLTLHFLGETNVDQTRTALQPVAVPTFSLTIEGVGQFATADGGSIVWAGVRKCDGLLRLHAAAVDALALIGYRPETRPYSPHVTLARCKAKAADIIEKLIAQQKDFQLPDQPVTTFGLYSSTVVGRARTYKCEQWFPLIAAATDGLLGLLPN